MNWKALMLLKPRVEFFTGESEVGTPYNEVWVTGLPDAGLTVTSGGHMGQTAPETRWLLMRCVLSLHQGQDCSD